jgi:hypothetical protein
VPFSFETSKNTNPATKRHIPEDFNIQETRYGSFKSLTANSNPLTMWQTSDI